jgi:hypothetical protein
MTATGKKWLSRSLWIIGIFLFLSLIVYRLAIWAGFEPWSLRKLRFATAAQGAEWLIAAIKAYERDRGVAPDSLAALVPRYIVKIPGTGLAGYPSFEYQRFTNSHYSLMWYDLGSRNGQPMAGLWCYPEGDPQHAILAFTVDQNGQVVEARVDRMPKAHQTGAFDAQRWRSKTDRIEMARSLPSVLQVPGADTNVVITLLGPPEGFRTLRDSPWELRIDCPRGMLNWDVFFYWPTQRYPNQIYGGSVERIGQWAYVHE